MVRVPFMIVASHTDVHFGSPCNLPQGRNAGRSPTNVCMGGYHDNWCENTWQLELQEVGDQRHSILFFFCTRLPLFDHRAPTQSVCVTDVIL